MSWKDKIQPSTAVWAGVEEYAAERIGELTQVCVSSESSDIEIRQAQAAIQELHRLVNLPNLIRAEAQIRGATSTRKEY